MLKRSSVENIITAALETGAAEVFRLLGFGSVFRQDTDGIDTGAHCFPPVFPAVLHAAFHCRSSVENIITAALETGADFAELYAERTEQGSIGMVNGRRDGWGVCFCCLCRQPEVFRLLGFGSVFRQDTDGIDTGAQ